jgi:hypothetical protein
MWKFLAVLAVCAPSLAAADVAPSNTSLWINSAQTASAGVIPTYAPESRKDAYRRSATHQGEPMWITGHTDYHAGRDMSVYDKGHVRHHTGHHTGHHGKAHHGESYEYVQNDLSAQHHRYIQHNPHTPNSATIKVIRPDATGTFPGDYSTIYYGAGIAFPGNPSFVPAPAADGKFDASKYASEGQDGKYSGGKYTPKYEGSKYTASSWNVSPPAYQAHEVFRPEGMTCYIISKTGPDRHIGQRYVCEY